MRYMLRIMGSNKSQTYQEKVLPMIALVIVLILIAILVPLMVRNAHLRSSANVIRAREAVKGNHLSRKTSYLAAKEEKRQARQSR
jgi:hypothetical protein